MDFFAPGTHHRQIEEGIEGIAGSIILPSKKPLDLLLGKDLNQVAYYGRRLLDPQMYLSILDPTTCAEKCANLATYEGWFPHEELSERRTTGVKGVIKWVQRLRKEIPNHWTGDPPSSAQRPKSIRAILATQQMLGCEALILPTLMTNDLNSDLAQELEWLDEGLTIGRGEFDAPLLASIVISDRALRDVSAYENRLVDTILDQVTAREPDGAYIVIEQAGEDGYYCTNQGTIGSVLRLVDGLKRGGLERVVVNYLGVAGLLAFCVGADDWCTGWYQSERRFRLNDLADTDDPRTTRPAFYSHALAGEIHMQNDFDRLMDDEGMLGDLVDYTQWSEDLLNAVAKGRSSAEVYDWQHKPARVTFAKSHFSAAMARESTTIASLLPDARLEYADSWLTGAMRLATKLSTLDDLHRRTEINHQRAWKKALAAHLDRR